MILRREFDPEGWDLFERMRPLFENGYSVTVEPDLTLHYHHYAAVEYTYRHDHRHHGMHQHPVALLLAHAWVGTASLLVSEPLHRTPPADR